MSYYGRGSGEGLRRALKREQELATANAAFYKDTPTMGPAPRQMTGRQTFKNRKSMRETLIAQAGAAQLAAMRKVRKDKAGLGAPRRRVPTKAVSTGMTMKSNYRRLLRGHHVAKGV